jgi:hypothetical protein
MGLLPKGYGLAALCILKLGRMRISLIILVKRIRTRKAAAP